MVPEETDFLFCLIYLMILSRSVMSERCVGKAAPSRLSVSPSDVSFLSARPQLSFVSARLFVKKLSVKESDLTADQLTPLVPAG